MKATLASALLTALLAGFFPASSLAEGVIVQWVVNRGGATVVDGAGNVIVTGGYDIVKYAAADGALIWRYDAPLTDIDTVRGMLAVDDADNVVTSGHTQMNGYDFYTAKHSSVSGGRLWQRQYNGIANSYDSSRGIAVDHAGNVFVTGYSEISSSDWDYYTAKYQAESGALLWERRYNAHTGPGRKNDQARGIAIDSSGNAIVTGGSFNSSGTQDIYTAKYAAADGALLWEVRYNGPDTYSDFSWEVAVDSTGNAVISGLSRQNAGNNVYYVAKYAALDGGLIWEKRSPARSEEYLGVAIDNADNVVVTARDYYTGSYAYTAKYAATDGTVLWENRGSNGESLIDLAVDSTGNVIVTGSSPGSGAGKQCYTAKYAAADGALLWEERYHGPSNGDDEGYSVAADSAGGVIVTGGTTGSDGSHNSYIVKYAPTDADNDGLLDSWEIEHFGNTAGQSALGDTDGDGAVELLELAFGTDPKSPVSVPAAAVVIEGGYLTTTITKQPCVRYVVETSATPAADFSAASTTVLTDTATTLKVRDNVSIGTQPGRFLRVRVSAPP